MAKGFKKGAGGANPLNFKVVGNPRPNNPKENTLWVNTDQKITGWVFGATQPDAENGLVWIKFGIASSVEFNALKKNAIIVFPLNVHQCNGSSWVYKESMIYQSGKWNSLVEPLTIVPNISKYPDSAWTKIESASISVTNTGVKASFTSDDNDVKMVYLDIDVTNFTTLELVGTATARATGTGSSSVNLKTGIFNGTDLVAGYFTSLKGGALESINNRYDISNLTGVYRFGFYFQVGSTSSYEGNFTMTSVVFS